MAKRKTKKRVGKPPSRRWALLWKVPLLLAGVALLGLAVLVLLVRAGAFGKLPTTEDLVGLRNEEATFILSAEGGVIGKIYAENRTSVLWESIPSHVVDALVATEDQRFFEHGGVDAFSYVRVFFRTILARDRGSGGGSTISQQLVKNLYGRERHGLLTLPVNKVKEAIVAHRLEGVYDKQEVIMLYLNSVPFGENVYGIEAAAERYFNKPAHRLRVEEGAVLIGMLKANTAYNPRLHPQAAHERRNLVLARMAVAGKLSKIARDSLQATPMHVDHRDATAYDPYGYFNVQVEKQARAILAQLGGSRGVEYDIEKDGLRIHTTLDTALQGAALQARAEQLAAMQPLLDRELRVRKARQAWERKEAAKEDARWDRNERKRREVFSWSAATRDTLSYRDSLWHYHSMLQSAFLMAEPGSGRVRAYSGGNSFRVLPYDQVQGRRPIASAIKPFIYAAGLEAGLDPCVYLNNERRTYEEYEDWSPQNYDQDTIGGEVAMWYALMRSMNIPTVDLYFRTGQDTLEQVFRALGLPADGVGNPAAALGAIDLSLSEVVRAYAAFANGGRLPELRYIERITDAHGELIWQAERPGLHPALPNETATAITAMLRRAVDNGTGATLRSRFGVRGEVAGKTGTSQDYADAWFVAYTPRLVAAAWVGARDPSIHFAGGNGTGARLALPIIGGTLAAVQQDARLRKRYMASFPPAVHEVDMDCPPLRKPDLLDRLFQGVFKKKEHPDRKKKKRKEGFFRKLFPKRR